MQKKDKIFTRTALAAGLAMGLGALVLLQGQQPNRPAQQAPPQLSSSDVSDEDLETFADIYSEVQVIRDELNRKLNAAQDPGAATQLQREASAEMLQVVTENDMEPDYYNALARSISSNEQLFTRFKEIRED